jgi:hypothetical protein
MIEVVTSEATPTLVEQVRIFEEVCVSLEKSRLSPVSMCLVVPLSYTLRAHYFDRMIADIARETEETEEEVRASFASSRLAALVRPMSIHAFAFEGDLGFLSEDGSVFSHAYSTDAINMYNADFAAAQWVDCYGEISDFANALGTSLAESRACEGRR